MCTLFRSGPLPLEAGEVKDKPEADTKLALITRLLALVKSGKVYFNEFFFYLVILIRFFPRRA